MADLSDVLNELVTLISALAYPSGVTDPQPSPLQNSAWGMPVRVYPGWPVPDDLDADMAVKPIAVCNVSVYPQGSEKNTTRYPQDWQSVSQNTATITLTASGQTVTVGGSVPNPISGNPHNLAVFVNGKPYVYAAVQGDTLSSIAGALAALIVVDIAGTSASGAVITLPAGARLGAVRVGVTGTSAQALRMQERIFQITVWADTPAHRDAIAAPIDVAVAAMTFLTLPDQFAARIRYHDSPMTDALEKSGIFRRDLCYAIEYETTRTRTDAQVVATELNVSVEPSGLSPAPQVTTVYA